MNDYFKQNLVDVGAKNTPISDKDKKPKTPPHVVFIGISGKKQVGKDTLAAMLGYILHSQGVNFEITSFAAPLKNLCTELFGIDSNIVYGDDKIKNSPCEVFWDNFPIDIRLNYSNEFDSDGKDLPRSGPMTVRELLQILGTDIFRSIDPDVWAKVPFRKERDDRTKVVIITDCRFPNERHQIEKHGGIVIRLERNTGFTDLHNSETSLDNEVFDSTFYYENNGTKDDLNVFAYKTLEILGLVKSYKDYFDGSLKNGE